MIWKKKKRVDREFDDTTPIVNMNVDGMPWYVPSAASRPRTGIDQSESAHQEQRPLQPLSRRETWSMIITAVIAALLVALIFILGAFLFIMFALHIWLK